MAGLQRLHNDPPVSLLSSGISDLLDNEQFGVMSMHSNFCVVYQFW